MENAHSTSRLDTFCTAFQAETLSPQRIQAISRYSIYSSTRNLRYRILDKLARDAIDQRYIHSEKAFLPLLQNERNSYFLAINLTDDSISRTAKLRPQWYLLHEKETRTAPATRVRRGRDGGAAARRAPAGDQL
ncbi:hypothetical protein EVAR_44928_1 [Eumeta japonica]|uniref:Uncharacterized protein n=1 Tax=Eumeta variegata TaxID=151549 RepID=A0A4C2A6N8_EUMVA|nr:hypothetical protein EVAR_44928_1 [Eumeta japonica]